jgi:Domain of unknown function (DUF1992)
MVLWLETLAEQKIREAMERGEFADLPGQGLPLDLTADPLVPQELRVAYRIVKNAGFLPPELEARKEIHDLEQLMRGMEAGLQRSMAMRKLHLLNTKLAAARRGSDLRVEAEYFDRLVKRFSTG